MNFFHTPNGKGTEAFLGKKLGKIFRTTDNMAPNFVN
jgi:hypothetical protein